MKTRITEFGRLICLLAAGCTLIPRGATQPAPDQVTPLPQAHSHNDYVHQRPLLEALEYGFGSVEADVFLVDGRLLVAHAPSEIQPDRSLEALYLDPLLKRVREHGGHVYAAPITFHLLIDLKSDGLTTYQALDQLLQQYTEMLCRFEAGRTVTNAVAITVSGNRPRDFMRQQPVRYAAYDGRLADLDSDAPPNFIPLVSDNWASHFQWRGQGPLSEAERMKLRELVQRAHEQRRKIRFWSNPDHPEGWTALRDAGVDLINTDDLPGLSQFLRPQSH